MEIKDLTYKQFALIREAMIEKREAIWQRTIEEPFKSKLKKLSFDEVKEIKRKFDSGINQFTDEGICNRIIETLEKIEIDIQKELSQLEA